MPISVSSAEYVRVRVYGTNDGASGIVDLREIYAYSDGALMMHILAFGVLNKE